MPAVQLGALLAVALAASTQDQVATAGRPPAAAVLGAIPPATSVMMGSLPPPPGKVVLETRTYGTVTVDHAAHLGRRTACRSCHGDGPVSKIGFTPRQAHDTCRSCHVDLKRGPTDCRGCHVLPAKPAEITVAEQSAPAAGVAGKASTGFLPAPPPPSAPAAPAGVTAAPPPTTTAIAGAAAGAPSGLPPPPPPPSYVGELEDEPEGELLPFHQSVEAGMVVLGGADQSAIMGPSLRLTSRYGRAVMVHSLESAGGFRGGRTMLMMGGGAILPMRPRLALLVVGIGGVDAASSDVWLLPAAGVRLGLQWTLLLPYLDAVSASVTGVSDLLRRRNAFGERVGDVTFSFTLAAGYTLDRGRP